MNVTSAILFLVLTAAQPAPTTNPTPTPAPTIASDTPVKLAATPVKVRNTIKSTAGSDKVDGIIRHVDEDGTEFAVEITKPDGSQRDLVIDSNGTLMSLEMSLDEVPALPQKAIKTQSGANKIVSIDQTFDEGQISYVVTVSNAGGEKDFTVNDNGHLERADISLADAPPVVTAAIKKQAGPDKIVSIEKVFGAAETSYDVTIIFGDGNDRTFALGPDGRLESMEITLAETPKSVQAMVTGVLGKNKLISVDKDFTETGFTYAFVMKQANGRERDFTVDTTGKLLTEQVYLDQLGLEVQKTINEQIGNGTILHINKSYEPDDGVLPFEIIGLKNGKEFNFSVGPRGRFIGMDN